MTDNLKLYIEADKTYSGWGSYTNGGTFDFATGVSCATDNVCIFNNNTVMSETSPGYGFHYNWYAATAGTGSSITSSTEIDAEGSICPENWRIPAYNMTDFDKSFSNLLQIYGNVRGVYLATPFQMYENYGVYYGGSPHYIITFSSGFWTSTSINTTPAEIFYHYLSADLRQWNKTHGLSLRCVSI